VKNDGAPKLIDSHISYVRRYQWQTGNASIPYFLQQLTYLTTVTYQSKPLLCKQRQV